MTSPDPVPAPPWPRAEIVTTEGRTWSATEVTLHTLGGAGLDAAGAEADDFVAATMTPPIPPPTTSAVPSAAHGSHRGPSRPCLDPFTPAPFHAAGAGPRTCRVPTAAAGRWAGSGPSRIPAG